MFVYSANNKINAQDLILHRGMSNYDFPIIYIQSNQEGHNHPIWTDFLNANCFNQCVVSDRVINLLLDNNINGWQTFPVEIYDDKENYIGGYNGLSVVGRCHSLNFTQTIKMEDDSFYGSRHLGFPLDLTTWDGCDIFAYEDTCSTFMTQKVKNLFKKHKISNIKFEDITEVIIIDKWNKFINDDHRTQL